MKTLFFLFLFFSIALVGRSQDKYTIRGTLSGKTEGMKVSLQKGWPAITFDSTIVKGGQFLLSGTVKAPEMCSIVIDGTPGDSEKPDTTWRSVSFYLENAVMAFTGDFDSLPRFYYSDAETKAPIITGSASQDLYRIYQSSTAALRKQYSILDGQYLKEYHIPTFEKNEFNTERGVELVTKMSRIQQKLDTIKRNFIRNHAATVVAYDLAMSYFEDMYIYIHKQHIDELNATIQAHWAKTEKGKAFAAAAARAKETALGAGYLDLKVKTRSGKIVKLSDYVPENKYVLLEFWASWCSPCRGEIPHLKHVYSEFKEKGFEIVSISIDGDPAQWEKALQQENMPWTQLLSQGEFKSEACRTYRFSGVPYALLLDKEGKILKTSMRGASLDAVLMEVL